MEDRQIAERLAKVERPLVIMMIGAVAAGKSTVAEILSRELGLPIRSSDALRAEITGSEADISRDAEVWPELYKRVEADIELQNGAIVDATHNTLFQREFDSRYYRATGAKAIAGVYVDAPLSELYDRNQNRSRVVPEPVIDRMHDSLLQNPPDISDGFDMFYSINNKNTD